MHGASHGGGERIRVAGGAGDEPTRDAVIRKIDDHARIGIEAVLLHDSHHADDCVHILWTVADMLADSIAGWPETMRHLFVDDGYMLAIGHIVRREEPALL